MPLSSGQASLKSRHFCTNGRQPILQDIQVSPWARPAKLMTCRVCGLDRVPDQRIGIAVRPAQLHQHPVGLTFRGSEQVVLFGRALEEPVDLIDRRHSQLGQFLRPRQQRRRRLFVIGPVGKGSGRLQETLRLTQKILRPGKARPLLHRNMCAPVYKAFEFESDVLATATGAEDQHSMVLTVGRPSAVDGAERMAGGALEVPSVPAGLVQRRSKEIARMPGPAIIRAVPALRIARRHSITPHS
jgi:hypothetical protein